MSLYVESAASDAAQNVADSLNAGNITGWDLLAALLVIVVSVPVARLVKAAIRRAFTRAGMASSDAAADIGRVAKWLVYLVGFAIALSILGVNVGFLSVLFAFTLILGALAVKPMIENSASGILLLSRPEFSIGDQIQTTEFRGVVEAISSRATQLRRDDGVVADPTPAVQAAAVTDDAITLTISYWYPTTFQTGSSVTDGVIRATMAALREADIALAVIDAEVTGLPTSAVPDDGTSDSS